jgi:3-phosphoshikimate 1-carboxyvinyltransferase
MRDTLPSYPDRLEIKPLERPPHATVQVPGSKSITNRALVLAALMGRHRGLDLLGILRSEDTEVMISALRQLGFQIDIEGEGSDCAAWVHGRSSESPVPASEADLFVGNSGTSMRFLTAMVALGHGRYRLDGVPRMRERPIEDLLAALRQLGVKAVSERGNGCPPVLIEAHGLRGGHVRIKGHISSQFLSGLLMVAPVSGQEIVIEIEGPLVSQPYVDMTVAMMRQFAATVDVDTPSRFFIPAQRGYDHWGKYRVEPDASAASYFLGAAAITGGEVFVHDLPYLRPSLQGDVRFADLLAEMGCQVGGAHTATFERTDPLPGLSWPPCGAPAPEGIYVAGGPLRGIDGDMNDISDTVMTLAAVACFADGPTTIRNVAHIRHKETDRLAALATELRRLGAEVDEFPDGLKVTPRPLHGAEVETYDDHRMAMSLALIGLRVPGVVIKDPACVAKTYPRFFEDLEKLRS